MWKYKKIPSYLHIFKSFMVYYYEKRIERTEITLTFRKLKS